MDRALIIQLCILFLKQELPSPNQKVKLLIANGYPEHKRSHVGSLIVKICNAILFLYTFQLH